MINKTHIDFVSNTTISIKCLYYDIIDNQFIINSNDIHNLQYIWWHGRKNPTELGKPMIYKDIHDSEIVDNITIGSESQTVFLARRYSPHNFAHLFAETAIPIEYIFNSNGVTDKSKRAVIFDDGSWDGFVPNSESEIMEDCDNRDSNNTIFWFEGDDFKRRASCDVYSNHCLLPLADTVIFDFKKYTKQQYNNNNNRYVKITNTVLFGIGYVSPFLRWWNDTNISHAIDTLNQKLYDMYLPSAEKSTIVQNTLTFIVKHGRRQVLNWEDIGQVLNKYATDNNLLYEQFCLDEISFEKQLEVMSRTKILITNGGACSWCSLFLQKPSIVTYFPILNCPMETELYKQLQRFTLVEYEHYDNEWQKNIKREDASYDVDIDKLKILLGSEVFRER
jgi:hypothetical protein